MDISKNPGPDASVTTSATVETTQQSDFSANDLYASLELPNEALNFRHYNVCSLTNKLDEIKLLLSTISSRRNEKPKLVLGISETFLNGSWSDASLQLDNYNIHRLDRAANKGGGLLVYIPSHLPINRRTDLEVQGMECICLELHFPRSKPCLFSFIYQPPPSNVSYFDLLDSLLNKIDCERSRYIILGDFNIDLLNQIPVNSRFIDLFHGFNYTQLISVATRPFSGNLLDHIFTNDMASVLKSGTLSLSLSDHLPVFVSWKSRSIKSKVPGHKTITFRSSKNFSIDNFLSDLDRVPWNTLEMFNDPNKALEQWYCLFNNVLDIHMPFKTRRVKIQHQAEWFSASISSAIKQRNNLHRRAIRYNTELHWREYRLARNQVVHLIRKAKRDFYRNSINCNLDNPKNLWKIIRNLAPSQCSNLPSHLLVDGIIYDSHIDIANLFNAHFVNIASSVVLNKNTSTTPNWDYLKVFVRSKLPVGVSFTIVTSEDGSAVDVVLYTSQMIDLIHVFILAPHQHGDVVIDRGCEINHQSYIDRLTGVAILGVIGFATGHIVEQEQRAVLPLSPITRQQHGNLVFIVGTHGL